MPTTLSPTAEIKKAGAIKIPSGQEVYDAIMSKVEPELVTKNLKKLDAPFTKETPDERKARYKRYSKAFVTYKKIFKQWATKLKGAVSAYKRARTRAAESIVKKEEANIINSLEAQMNSL